MDRYIIQEEQHIEHQQGDSGELAFEVYFSEGKGINLNTLSNKVVIFHVYGGRSLVLKKEDDDWTIDGQNLTTPLEEEDTRDLYGKYRWGLRIKHDNGTVTIGKGDFTVYRKPLIV